LKNYDLRYVSLPEDTENILVVTAFLEIFLIYSKRES